MKKKYFLLTALCATMSVANGFAQDASEKLKLYWPLATLSLWVSAEDIHAVENGIDGDEKTRWGAGKENTEIILAVPVNTEMVSWNDWHMFVLPSDFASNGMPTGYECANSTWAFYDSFEPSDVRNTYLVASYTAKDGSIVDRTHPGTHMELGPIPMKLGYDTDIAGSGGKSSIDLIIYRLADVYLSLAEALYMKPNATAADKSEALGYINQIRHRAGIGNLAETDIDTEDKFVDVILTERSHELWCENGQYRADLIRLNKFVEHAVKYKGTTYANKTKELYPLPLSAINDGKGLVVQNPGY